MKKKTNCLAIDELQDLACIPDPANPDLLRFRQHLRECDRCLLLWGQIITVQDEIISCTKPDQNYTVWPFAKALTRIDSIVLTPLPLSAAGSRVIVSTTKKAADSGVREKPRLRELCVLHSEVENIYLRVLKNENEQSLNFYISTVRSSAQTFALFLPELDEPLCFDEHGYACIPADTLIGIPKVAVLAPE